MRTMTFAAFRTIVFDRGWTISQLRCNTPPSDDMIDLINRVGLGQWEKYVSRIIREADANLTEMTSRRF